MGFFKHISYAGYVDNIYLFFILISGAYMMVERKTMS